VGPAIVLAAALAAASPGPASRADEPVAREVGCFPDNRDADPIGTRGRDLDGAAYKDPSMTLNKCLSFCSDQGFKFAGLQYGSWCFCGNSYGRYTVGGASCTTRCGGDPAQFCGGEWANNVWEILESKAAVPPPPMAPATALQRFDQPKLGGIRLDSRPSGTGGFDVVGVAHSFCQRMGYAGMLEYRVADAGQTIAIDDGTLFANDRNSNTTYRFIVCGP
jgi:hypothetical protein